MSGKKFSPCLGAMTAKDRARDRGTRRGDRLIATLGEEFRDQRVGLGLSQRRIADAVGMSASWYSRAERAKVGHLAVVDAARIAAVLGLDLVVRTYPGGASLRDSAHAERLGRVLSHVRAPLRYRVEVPLPHVSDRPEPRAWDAMLYGGDRRTAVELEMRIRDAQAMIRRQTLKRRDDPVDGFLLVMAATRTNRRVLAELTVLLPDLPRLRTQLVLEALEIGQHPPSGIILI
jgi:transcriptional regulator with XRE-family HTH domain